MSDEPHPSEPRTVDLVRAAQARSAEALELLLRRYYPIAIRIAELRLGRKLRGNVEAEDIAQGALVDVFRGLDHFDAARSDGAFRNWLATIVENNIREHFRNARALKRGGGAERALTSLPSDSYADALLPGPEATPSALASARELEERIEHVLMNVLQDPYREVIIQHKLCGMSHEEVARHMNIESTGTVRSLYSRAMEKLREQLRDASR